MIIGLTGPFNPQAVLPLLHEADRAIAPPGVPGAPVEMLAAALVERGHSVVVYTLIADCPHPLTLTGPRLTIHMGAYRARHRMRDAFAQERQQLAAMMVADPPDILNAHWGYEYALAAQAANVAPIVVSLHDWAPAILYWQRTPYRLGRLLLYWAVLRRSRWLVTSSPYMEGRVKRWFGRESQIIPNGLTPAALAPTPRSYPKTSPRLLAINQGFSRFKNVHTLLRAFPLVRAVFPSARLRLLGYDHEPEGPAHRWAAARGLCAGVDFVGQVSTAQVRQELAQAHALVHPSQTEAFGLVVIEAMGQGTPVIAAAEAEAPAWILGHGACGVLAPGRSPRRFADACIGLLSDPLRWEHLSAASRDAVERRFSMAAVADAHEALFRSVLSAEPPITHR